MLLGKPTFGWFTCRGVLCAEAGVVQWNLSEVDTIRVQLAVLCDWGAAVCVLIIELCFIRVPFIERFHCLPIVHRPASLP